jgi:uncharacterized protein with HEPN domain
MTFRKDAPWLIDIRQAIEKIEHHPKYGFGRQGYEEDEYFRDVVYLHIERICEAATHLCREFGYEEKYPEIPWAKIVKMRIILAHHYWNVEDDIVWNVVEQQLPMLKTKVEEWLKGSNNQ